MFSIKTQAAFLSQELKSQTTAQCCKIKKKKINKVLNNILHKYIYI